MVVDDFLFSILNNPIKWTKDVVILYICEDKNMVIIYYKHMAFHKTWLFKHILAPEESIYDRGAPSIPQEF